MQVLRQAPKPFQTVIELLEINKCQPYSDWHNLKKQIRIFHLMGLNPAKKGCSPNSW